MKAVGGGGGGGGGGFGRPEDMVVNLDTGERLTLEEVDEKLVGIMNRIFATCDDTARGGGT